jgi:hypothetical protein
VNRTQLQDEYQKRCQTPSDINELLPALSIYARQCVRIVEFGTRTGNSTVALLHGLSEGSGQGELVSIDIDQNAIDHTRGVLDPDGTGFCGRARLTFLCGDSLNTKLEDGHADMIFIDTLHTYTQLKQELALLGNKAKKFLAFHDTTTFGLRSEDETLPGLEDAIDEFLAENRHWTVGLEKTNNNGLVVLERDAKAQEPKPVETTRRSIDRDGPDDPIYWGLDQLIDRGFSYEIGFGKDEKGADLASLKISGERLTLSGSASTIRGALEKIQVRARGIAEFATRVGGV